MTNKQGFTLIEISIVLVIIGLLTGAVLKGQQMIENARYRSLLNQIDSIRAAFHTFTDRYGYYPGDMPNASTRLSAPDGVVIRNGNGNGILNGGQCENDGESCIAWQHLILAELIPGDKTATGLDRAPLHAYGGRMNGISQVWVSGRGYIDGIELILKNVPGEVAQRLDEDRDDGDPKTGTILERWGNAYSDNKITIVGVKL